MRVELIDSGLLPYGNKAWRSPLSLGVHSCSVKGAPPNGGFVPSVRYSIQMEEAHNIFPAPAYGESPNGGLENVYREIRSFGQALVAITQHPSMLPIYVLGNTHTLIFMALTHEADIIAARQALFLERNQDVFLDRLKVGEGIVKIKGRLPPTHVLFKQINVRPGAVKDEDLRK